MSRQTIGAGFKPGLVDCFADQTDTGSVWPVAVGPRSPIGYNGDFDGFDFNENRDLGRYVFERVLE